MGIGQSLDLCNMLALLPRQTHQTHLYCCVRIQCDVNLCLMCFTNGVMSFECGGEVSPPQ